MKQKKTNFSKDWETRLRIVPKHTLAQVVFQPKVVPTKLMYNNDGTLNELNYGAMHSNFKKFKPKKNIKSKTNWNTQILV